MPQKGAFDFARFNAETTNFYLIINPSEKLDVPILQIPAQITRSIKAGIRIIAKNIRNKSFSRELRTIEITISHSFTADEKFTRNADGTWVPVLIQNVNLAASARP